MTQMKKLTAAINTIGNIFTEMYDKVDEQGVVTPANRLGFLQDKLLNGICYQLANALDYTTQKTLPQARDSVQRYMRAHDGTEIAELNLQRSMDWIDRLNEQVALTSEALEVAKEQYLKHTGREFHYGRRPVANEGVTETPAMARAKALGLAVNVAATHNSNKPF